MRIRTKRLLSLLITAAMVFNMGSVSFAEDHTGDGYDGYDTEFEIDEKSTVTAESGWVCENADKDKADVSHQYDVSENMTKSIITPLDIVRTQTSERHIINYAQNVDLRYSGTMNSGTLLIDVHNHSASENFYTLNQSNKVVISVSRGDIDRTNDEDNQDMGTLVVYISNQKLGTATTGRFLYELPREIISFDLEEGLTVKRKGESMWSRHFYDEYVISSEMDFNQPALSVNKQLGDYTVTYYTKIPYYGKGKRPSSKTTGDVLISDNKTGKTYKAVVKNVIRLKNAKSGQGPFPTVSNAGMQIKKICVLESKTDKKGKTTYKTRSKLDKNEKKVQKDLKKLTKVNKKNGYESQALPIIIYPKRLTNETVAKNTLILKGKAGKYSIKYNKLKIKNGGKDSFKTGTHKIEFDRDKGILTIDSADVWTGYNGLSSNYIIDKTKK